MHMQLRSPGHFQYSDVYSIIVSGPSLFRYDSIPQPWVGHSFRFSIFIHPLSLVPWQVSGWMSSLVSGGLSGGCLNLSDWLHLYWLFPTVRFQMSPQTACTIGCIVRLVAFMWCFSTVCFQMCPPLFCVWSFKVTLVTLVWLLSNVHFQMCL